MTFIVGGSPKIISSLPSATSFKLELKKLSWCMSTRFTSIFKDPNIVKHLSLLYDKYVIFSIDKAPNHIVFVCKLHYRLLDKEIRYWQFNWQSYKYPEKEILDNHRSILCSFGISTIDEELDLPSLYWIPKLHKCPFKQRYFVGSTKCSTKPLSKLLKCILQGSYWTKGSSWLSWSHHFESFTVATMTWLTIMEYLCHKWPQICSTCRKHFPVLSSFMTYHRVCN